ncbi:hypothetical protein N9Z18_02090 [Verrucomicrobiales bacterium]|nr:hypothetical protein [Verrucomicrobiales bacterium]
MKPIPACGGEVPDGKTVYAKDAFAEALIKGEQSALKPDGKGTKAAAVFERNIAPAKTQRSGLDWSNQNR